LRNCSYFLRKGVPANDRNDETVAVAVAYFAGAVAAAAGLCCLELAERKRIVEAKGLPGSVAGLAAVAAAAVVVVAAYLWRMGMTAFFFPGPLR
jgi:ammonia channel protein AmtB